ncbi:MAG: four-helix bundle copper-binding protein [Chitinophagaceae bacterium]|nr:four-helix bundle copper-binding protein [Chitinophagaceae bacterium]MBN8668645.1 four-helix bundle copper-binding protein [Chitinophagales bacterium]
MKLAYEPLVQTLTQCAKHCDLCASACLHEEYVGMMVECIRLNLACSSMCQALAKLLIFESPQINALAIACSQIGTACAQECAKHSQDHCQECARVCQEMAEQCGSFAASP